MHTVLIAEDDLIFLKLLTMALHKFKDKFEFISARNGEDAIEILNQKSISLLVTDIQMPKVDGFELLAYVNEHHPIIPCIVMTGYEPEKPFSNDIIYLFPKPLDSKMVGQVIVQILEWDIPRDSSYGISVVRFLEMIEMERRTCLFEVNLPNKERGLFCFDNGVLCDAIWGDLKREEAVMELITTESSKFRFKYIPKKQVAKRVKIDLSNLIREAKRRKMGLTPKKFTD